MKKLFVNQYFFPKSTTDSSSGDLFSEIRLMLVISVLLCITKESTLCQAQ
ncbi:MAG: hypothetical protein ACXAEU_03255 [Candidatus Hodarchaeales archaeon]